MQSKMATAEAFIELVDFSYNKLSIFLG